MSLTLDAPLPGGAGALPAAVRSALPALPTAPVTWPSGQPEPLPLPQPDWGVAAALEALTEARLALPVPHADPVVVSALSTVVLRCGDRAVKVYPPGTDATHLDRTTTALAGSATALLPDAAPVVTSTGVVTLLPWLPDATPVTWAETGALLARFHAEHDDADVAAWAPLRRLETQVEGLPDDAAAVLLGARDALRDALDALRSPLGVGVVHGDLSPSNVMRGPSGPVLIDLDWVARAPREYDLGSAARRFDAGELDAATYLGFCRAYGADVRGWEGRAVLDRIAALGGVAFRLWDDRRRGVPLSWLDGAVAEWRTPL